MRELRNHGGRVPDRVAAGETVLVTRDGVPVAELTPLRSPHVDAASLLERWRHIPAIDSERLQADLDGVLGPGCDRNGHP